MDIRKFFGPASGGSKKPPTESKPQTTPPTKPKPKATTDSKKSKVAPKKQTSSSSKSQKPAKSKPPVSSDDEVEIIPDSNDESTYKKPNRRKDSIPLSKSKGNDCAAKSNKTATAGDGKSQLKETIASKSKPSTSTEEAKVTEENASKSKPSTPPEAKSTKGKTKAALVNGDDSDSEVSVSRGKTKRTPSKTRSLGLTESERDEEASPLKRVSSRNKRRVLVLSDSDEEDEKKEEEVKVRRGRKRNKVNSDDEETARPNLKKKGSRIVDSDSGEETEEPQPKKKRGGRRKKEPVVYVDDSDEEPKVPRKGSLDAFVIHNAPRSNEKEETSNKSLQKKEEEEEKKKQAINVADFFGGGTVHRTERPKAPPVKRKVADTVEAEFHDDDDFTKTLQQLDMEQAKKPRREASPERETTEEEEAPPPASEGGSSLASRLSARMKTTSSSSADLALAATSATATRSSPRKRDSNSNLVVVPDTPDEKKILKKGTVSSAKVSPGKGVGKMEVTKNEKSSVKPPTEWKTPAKSADQSNLSSAEKKTPGDNSDKGSAAKRNWGSYRSFLNREGPRALGSKEIPQGAENCLEGLTFVLTGVLESIDRDETKSLIERYGGKVTGSISQRTSYLVIGRDAGNSKVAKAEQCRTKQLDEDGLLDLIRTMPGKKSKHQEKAEQAFRKEQSLQKSGSNTDKTFTSLKSSESRLSHSDSAAGSDAAANQTPSLVAGSSNSGGGGCLMWVDKHKPASLKQIIGQQGDKSNAKKLLSWIQRWHKNRAAGVKPTGRFYGQDDGSGHRAALLSGPPGIGKTTTAVLVCKEAGFSTVELNASDKRSKRSLKEDVAEALNNQTLVDYMGENSASGPPKGDKHCLIMDEVDGMAGNEDRGGLQELVALIKTTRIPVLCICNDRNSMKMRTLSAHCFDLRFQRPRLEQVKGALMSIAYKEGLKISPPALQELILSSNQDIRQCIHNMSMWTANHKELTYDQAKQDANQARKDLRLGIFDVARKIFAGGDETAKMTLNNKSDLFFQDYNFVPLFVHENYVGVSPYGARGDRKRHLSLLARAADSISEGDLVDRQVRGNGNWNLLPTQAMFASVIPGEYMRGSVSQMIQFPAWLGRHSSTTKNDRILRELRSHMSLQLSCDKRGLNMDYLPALRSRLTSPLTQPGSEGVPQVISIMDDYDIVKDDFDNILDITKWPNSEDPMARLDSKTKAAFTRQYNKESHMTPYATGVAARKKRGRGGTAAAAEDYEAEEGEGEGGGNAESESEGEEESLERDTMIKVKKKPDKASAAGTSKGKGPAKGKGQSSASAKGKGKGRRAFLKIDPEQALGGYCYLHSDTAQGQGRHTIKQTTKTNGKREKSTSPPTLHRLK